MNTSPRKRLLKGVLLRSLQRYRQTVHLRDDEFESSNADYADHLREIATAYDRAPPDLLVEEKPGFSGYDEWASSYDDNDENPVIQGEEIVLGDLSARYPADSVLDFGAGTGRHAIPYARSGARVTAGEPSEKMLAVARARATAEGLDIEFRQDDLGAPFEDDRVFDLVLCCLVLSHVEDLGSGDIQGYPGMPATLSLVFRR